MADRPPHLGTDDDHHEGSDTGPIAGTPRWVIVFGIIALIVVVLFVVLLLAGGGGHGPSRH